MAGRCISSDVVAHASLRIQQTCMAMGEAAGTAAALSIAKSTRPDELDPAYLVNELRRLRESIPPAYENFSTLPPSTPENSYT